MKHFLFCVSTHETLGRTNWEKLRAEIISCNKTRWDEINMGSPDFKASLCISIPKIKTAPFRQLTYFLLPLRLFTYSTHAATWDKLTGPFLLFPFTLNLFKHVIHAHPSLLIHRVISPPCGSVHIPINKTFPEYTSLCRAETSHLYPQNSRPKYSCWRHIHNA